ncbi:hypothetical protein ScPMuIL_000148 [Solemya velum]
MNDAMAMPHTSKRNFTFTLVDFEDDNLPIPQKECGLTPGERLCEDGSCVQTVDLCPEEQLMNKNTILIMIVVGMAVVIFLIILYCFQRRTRRSNMSLRLRSQAEAVVALADNESDNISLFLPPPTYNEVMTTDLYPPTPELRRQVQPSIEEPPLTPPPNYDAALNILAQSHECVFSIKQEEPRTIARRSISLDFLHQSKESASIVCDNPNKNDVSLGVYQNLLTAKT